MRVLAPLVLVLCAAVSGGCVAVAAGAAAGYGAHQVAKNSDVRVYEAPFPIVWRATMESMRDAGYPVDVESKPVGTSGAIGVNGASVEVWSSNGHQTSVKVKIGTFTTDAHRSMSAQIHDGVARRVGTRP